MIFMLFIIIIIFICISSKSTQDTILNVFVALMLVVGGHILSPLDQASLFLVH